MKVVEWNNHRLVQQHGRENLRRMRQGMAGTLFTLLLILPMMAAGSEDEETIDIYISKTPGGFRVTLDWDYQCLLDERNVTFTAVYKKLGAPDNESQTCDVSGDCSCWIPSAALDRSHNYTLWVTARTPDREIPSASQDFYPNREMKPPPVFYITSGNALVVVSIQEEPLFGKEYNLSLRRNDSSSEKFAVTRLQNYIIPPSELLPEQIYCLKMTVYDISTLELSPFSPEKCFTAPAPGPPNNLSMDALDLTYILKWDWDFDQSPNATFSVERCLNYKGCNKIKGCENITTPRCNCSGLTFIGKFILRVSVYHGRRREKSSSVLMFSPSEDTVFGPPKYLKMGVIEHKLFINVTDPEGFRHSEIYNYCTWRTSLSYWINSTDPREAMVKEDEQPFYTIDSLEPSTTYCAKAKKKCMKSNRSSLYSQEYCITTDPRSYLVAWIIGFTFLGIVLTSTILYLCFCPFKRYMKQIFFPSNKLPSSVEKGLGNQSLDCIRKPFFSYEEEITDNCTIEIGHTEDLGEDDYNKTSQANSQDSGNYSHEGQTTGQTFTQ
ncbi:interferon alpha/beta receptor 1 [Dendrobates tinctorius]|uniref:interferon alpha/beta receptor 1 n=1 Tax=Dendrobates tinctorius TaxID=92724 RepID=UPI003CCA4F09